MSNTFLLANNATTTLASGISNSALSLTVATGTGSLFPSPGAGQVFRCTLVSVTTPANIEVIEVTSRSGDTFTIGTRDVEGAGAFAYVTGDTVEVRLTVGVLANYADKSASQTISGAWTYSTTPTINGSPAAAIGTSLALNIGHAGLQ